MTPGYRPRGAARRQALAERHRPRDVVEHVTGGRFHGRCEACGEIHRSPDMRYRCPGCALEVCLAHAQELEYVCPGCGGRLELDQGELT
ncbi:MAG: hypothetical protein JW990_00230 [Thermoleophilia bacterium]|nr:hypothetical protein [Thermoleophilia bacterium]